MEKVKRMETKATKRLEFLRTKEFWWKVLEYSMPALISCLVFLLAMIIKGVAPFGDKSLAYIDYNEGLVPAYTSLWDCLHGNGSFVANFKHGAGAPSYASNIINTFLSPLSLLIVLFPRENIIYGIAFLLFVKFALMSTTAYICFKKFFGKVDQKVLMLFSIIWTFSGWTIIHFTNINWLDIMILLPLFILSFKRLVTEGKMLWFVIILSYMLCLSYYITYMVLVGVVVISIVYYFTIAPKDNRKRTASLLFYGIMISIAISLVAFIPSCVTSLGGHRFVSDTTETDKTWLYDMFMSKVAILLMQALPVVFFVKLMTTIKKDKKTVLFFLLSFCICGVGIFIEPINMMWHAGSYFSFPFRYSFIIVLLMIFGSLYYINKYYFEKEPLIQKDEPESDFQEKIAFKNEKSTDTKKLMYLTIGRYILLSFALLVFAFTSVVFVYMGKSLSTYRQISPWVFAIYLFNFLSQMCIILFVLSRKNKLRKLSRYTLVAILCMVSICSQMTGFTGVPFVENENNTARITNVYNISTSQFDSSFKLKDRDSLYNLNFAQLLDYPTLQTWIHISSEQQYQAYHYLGYNTNSTYLYSSGGTYLTDVLLGNKYVLSNRELDSNYYLYKSKFDYYDENENKNVEVLCYEMNFSMKPAWTTNVDLSKINNDSSDIVDNQNTLYRALYGKSDNIMEYTTYTYKVLEDKIVLTVNCVADQNLYLVSNGDVVLMTYDQKDFEVKNGFNDFGTMSGTQFVVEIEYKANEGYWTKAELEKLLKENVKFATFDVQKFKLTHEASINSDKIELKTKGNSIEISVNNESDSKYLFVPFINLKDMNATNNDKEIGVQSAILNFMQIEINSGNNAIKMHNSPQLIKPCLMVTIVAIVIFVIMSILNKRLKISENKFIIYIGLGGACVIVGVVGFLVYLKPFVRFFVALCS